jgi:hypothetical protein
MDDGPLAIPPELGCAKPINYLMLILEYGSGKLRIVAFSRTVVE